MCEKGYHEEIDIDNVLGDAICVADAPATDEKKKDEKKKDEKKKGGLSFGDIISAVGQLGKVGADFWAVSKGQSTQPIINNNYTTDPTETKPDEMPMWAIALIVLVVLVLLAVLFTNMKKKGKGEIN